MFGITKAFIVVNCFQFLTILNSVQADWPPELSQFFAYLSIANLNVELAGVECADPACGFGCKSTLYVVAPMCMVAIAWLCWLVIWIIGKAGRCNGLQRMRTARAKRATVVILAMSYLIVTLRMLQGLNCEDINGVQRLVFHKEVICNSSEHNLPVIIAGLVLYTIGIPVALSVFVFYKVRPMVKERPNDMTKTAIMFVGQFKPHAYWFQCFQLLMRLLTIAAATLTAPNAFLGLNLLLLLLFVQLVAVLAVKPFQFESESYLNASVLIIQIFNTYSGVLFSGSISPKKKNAVQIVVFVVYGVAATSCVVALAHKCLQKRKLRKLEKAPQSTHSKMQDAAQTDSSFSLPMRASAQCNGDAGLTSNPAFAFTGGSSSLELVTPVFPPPVRN